MNELIKYRSTLTVLVSVNIDVKAKNREQARDLIEEDIQEAIKVLKQMLTPRNKTQLNLVGDMEIEFQDNYPIININEEED